MKKLIRNYESPSEISYETSIIGVGDGFDRYECYFIFSNNTKTVYSTERPFKEILLAPPTAVI